MIASSLPVLVGSVLVGTASAVAGALAVRAEKLIERDDAAPKRLGGGTVRVRDLDDPLALGVHLAPPMTLPDGSVNLTPAFVRRDAGARLEDALKTSRFVLVVGESTAGKSRAAYEAMRACLPGHVFIRPAGREDLPEALARAQRQRRCVVWLDELDNYLGVNGLTASALSPLFADPDRHRVVLATMRSHERARHSPRNGASAGSDEAQHHRPAGDVIRLATEIRIERLWSAAARETTGWPAKWPGSWWNRGVEAWARVIARFSGSKPYSGIRSDVRATQAGPAGCAPGWPTTRSASTGSGVRSPGSPGAWPRSGTVTAEAYLEIAFREDSHSWSRWKTSHGTPGCPSRPPRAS
uniref:hypothetical protein n=1 Tax=Herbidospora sakaeratensis TaxID=564415 RepID=UPI000782CCC3|nr:hypothetical protein [Herbidospora sakaeratensis]